MSETIELWEVSPVTSSKWPGLLWRVERNRWDDQWSDMIHPLFMTRNAADVICQALNDGEKPEACGLRVRTLHLMH